jgi:hypothetical protein
LEPDFDGFTSGFFTRQGNKSRRVHGRARKDFADAALLKSRRADAGVRFQDRSIIKLAFYKVNIKARRASAYDKEKPRADFTL